MNTLIQLLNYTEPGEIANTADLEKALSAAWDDLAGSGDGGMDCWKLFGRMEKVYLATASPVVRDRKTWRDGQWLDTGRTSALGGQSRHHDC